MAAILEAGLTADCTALEIDGGGGVVTDSGGALVHAMIVGREYGLPAVAGTMEGTKKIKTGDRIRVDGDMCAVYIMS